MKKMKRKGAKKMKFYKIEDQVVISDKSLSVGTELIPNTTDAAGEKHVPVIELQDNKVTVKVGSVEHPSLEAHYIEFIAIETDKGMQMKWGKPGAKPAATFYISEDETLIAAYEYCNLHGLWKGYKQ